MRPDLVGLLAVVGFAVLTMPVFAARAARRGPDRLESPNRGSFVLGSFLRDWFYWFIGPVERASLALGLTPLFFNLTGVAFGIAGGVAFASGWMVGGGWGVLLGGVADVLDGRVARAQGVASRRGAFLDSSLDRFAEVGAFVGLAFWFRGNGLALVFVVVALGGSLLVSYTRARGESVGVLCKSGIMQRAERLLLLGFGGLLDPSVSAWMGREAPGALLVPALGVIALGTLGTAVYRTVWIATRLPLLDDPESGPGHFPEPAQEEPTQEEPTQEERTQEERTQEVAGGVARATAEGVAEDPLAAAVRWIDEGRGVALATVVGTWGSSPRPAGSQLCVSDRRELVGSVSGGCVEGAVVEEAQEVIVSGRPKVLEYGVTDEDAWAVGLACGGRVRIYVERAGGKRAFWKALLEARGTQRSAVMATALEDGRQVLLYPLEERAPGLVDESAPLTPDSHLRDAASEAVQADTSRSVTDPEGREVFLNVYNPAPRLVVVGAVHIAQPLVGMAARLGFRVTVVDPRTAFATEERFPGVELVLEWPAEALAALALDRRTAVVTLTHDPKLDDPALEAALSSPAFYVGALGSRRTHTKRLERLREQAAHLPDGALERIRAPVGMDIGAKTPAEIGVSVLADVVAALRAGGA